MGKSAKKRREAKFQQRQAQKAQTETKVKIPFVLRPFEGLVHEPDLVALRELLPAAKLVLRTNAQYGAQEFDLVTLLPAGASAIVREDGRLLVAAQTAANSPDASHDLAAAILAGQQTPAGQIVKVDLRQEGPRLQDILDHDFETSLQIYRDFTYWVDPDGDADPEQLAALEETAEQIVPCTLIPGVDNMYHFRMNGDYVRWIRLEDGRDLEDALARLQADQQLKLGEGSRFLGIFRSLGLLIPVFEVPSFTDPESLEVAAKQLEDRLAQALEDQSPLSDAQRRAKAGILARQVSLR